MKFKYPCKFYGKSGMASDNKFEAEFNRLCRDKPRYLFIFSSVQKILPSTHNMCFEKNEINYYFKYLNDIECLCTHQSVAVDQQHEQSSIKSNIVTILQLN